MLEEAYAGLSIFSGLSTEQLQHLDTLLVRCQYPAGITIFEQGQPAMNLYIVAEGEITISYKPYDGPALTVARIQPGGVFGWSAALGHDVYTSSALAACNTTALCVPAAGLRRFCEQYRPTAAIFVDRLAGGIAVRLNDTHGEVLSILTRALNLCDNSDRRDPNA